VRQKICKEALQALGEQLNILKGLLMEEYMYLTMLNAGVTENSWLLRPRQGACSNLVHEGKSSVACGECGAPRARAKNGMGSARFHCWGLARKEAGFG
jgi:hypothetical protein